MTSLQPPPCNFNTILGSFPVILNASNYPHLSLYNSVYSALKYPHRQIRTQSLNQTNKNPVNSPSHQPQATALSQTNPPTRPTNPSYSRHQRSPSNPPLVPRPVAAPAPAAARPGRWAASPAPRWTRGRGCWAPRRSRPGRRWCRRGCGHLPQL